ncbi:hypothetical protein SLS53_004018 [Cytospora paraplurivora]|uniref:Uncharacterized protein n=1 Tax=Cytospora paraplurivora TaxID=2898453 RepID=A0AAN9U8E4_9PEZI
MTKTADLPKQDANTSEATKRAAHITSTTAPRKAANQFQKLRHQRKTDAGDQGGRQPHLHKSGEQTVKTAEDQRLLPVRRGLHHTLAPRRRIPIADPAGGVVILQTGLRCAQDEWGE